MNEIVQRLQDALQLHQQGRLPEAADGYRGILRAAPGNVDALNLLGVACCQMGEHKEGIRLFKKCIKVKPDFAQAHGHLGDALIETKSFKEAIASLRRAVALASDWAEAHSNLGYALHESGQFEKAVGCYLQALALKPDLVGAHNHLGNAYLKLERKDDAERSFRRALEISADFVPARNNLGLLLVSEEQYDEAEACFRKVIDLDPAYASAYLDLARLVARKGMVLETEGYCTKALALVPFYVESHKTLADALAVQGRYAEAEEHLTEALRINPNNFESYCALRFFYCFLDRGASEKAIEVGRQCSRMFAKQASRGLFKAWTANPKPERLRVGLVSGDLRNHPVGYFLESTLANIDTTRIELIAYPTVPFETDLTRRISPFFSRWEPIAGMSDFDASRLIHADGVHVLLDLSGYTANTRLPVFAWQPAPVQTTWLGYFATTGIEQMDYLLADPVSVPNQHRDQFTEEVWYLPETRLCFTAPTNDVAIMPLPAADKGYVTFGCFQNPSKINDDVLRLWAQILASVPNARLRIQAKQFADLGFVEHFRGRCRTRGLDVSRLLLVGHLPREEYFAAHGEVDIILDTFPYPGGTTTCEALWMGVPTLTLAGNTMIARQGASLLSAAGLNDWIASGEAEYVDKAIAFAADLTGLAELRSGLRQKVLASPLFDAARFARHLEDALWGMWQAKGVARVTGDGR